MLGLIGGTGLEQLEGLELIEQRWFDTPYGEPSSILTLGELDGVRLAFIARHGVPNKIAPHLINYRANLDALKQIGVNTVLAVNAVGGIHENLGPARIAIPDQIIDYSYGRVHTIYDGVHHEGAEYIDFTFPYTPAVREKLISAAKKLNLSVMTTGTYAVTQGPRLETSAEIRRYRQDGCDMVGMTGMPEAAIAKEMGLDYASIAVCVNWAAGIYESIATIEEIHTSLEAGMAQVHQLIHEYLKV